jgi:hypothetical protein
MNNMISNSMITPQMKQQIKAMYQLYKGNPQGFIQQAMQSIPALKNNPMLMNALQGGGSKQMFTQMLSSMGMSEQDFKSLLE